MKCSLTHICIGICSVCRYLCIQQNTGEAHKAKSLSFELKNIPLFMMRYGSKEQTFGKIWCKQVDFHFLIKLIELYSPWKNDFERKSPCVRCLLLELPDISRMTSWSWKLIYTLHLHSVNSIYSLDGKVPKTYMSRETNDWQFCKPAWYK